jgi:hypothetical protein
MGLNLGLAMANAYLDADKQRIMDERTARRFDWERQRAEAEMGLLADKSESERENYRLLAAQRGAGLDLVRPQTDATRAQLAASTAQARLAAGQSEIGLSTLPQQRAAAQANADVNAANAAYASQNIPRTLSLADARATNDQSEQLDKLGARMYERMMLNDSDGATELYNAALAVSPGGATRPKASKSQRMSDGGGNQYQVFYDDAGGRVGTIPLAGMERKYGASKPIILREGQAAFDRGQDGQVRQIASVPKTAGAGANRPTAEQSNIKFYADALGISIPEAISLRNQGKIIPATNHALNSVREAERLVGRKLTDAETQDVMKRAYSIWSSANGRSGDPSALTPGAAPGMGAVAPNYQEWAR